MLQPADPAPPTGNERSIGELASQLVDDGKAYAKAELNLATAIAAAKANAAKVPLALLVASLFVAMGALNALCVAIYMVLASMLGLLIGGIVAFVLIGGIAAFLGWMGISKLKDAL